MQWIVLSTVLGVFASMSPALGAGNIDPVHVFAWSENTGWLNWRDADAGAAGVQVRTTILSGSIWAENTGWISLGDGRPADGLHYANLNAADFGVNIDPPTGDLFGLAWGENIGWINFDTRASIAAHGQQARVDYAGTRLRGYAWGENVGWINLDEATHFVAFVWPSCGDLFADSDLDGDVDHDDFGAFQRCHTGTHGGLLSGCECFNRPEPGYPRGDNDADLADLEAFIACMSGPMILADPGCTGE